MANHLSNALPVGTRLQEFEINSIVGAGGFGIVYLAIDQSLDRRIALKEYMPSQFAYRSGTTIVKPRSSGDVETFEVGLRSFINEARLLAQFDHPALVKVHRFWHENGTGYMAMPFYEGLTLKEALLEMQSPPDEDWLRQLLAPLLEACATLHAARCFHRDIAPDNILLTRTGPVLLDFGAARRVIGDAAKTLTVILKEGYAPIEQYGGGGPSMQQGPWTDIYALCGVLRYAVTGKPPASAIERLMADRNEPLVQLCQGRYSQDFLGAIDAGLAIKPGERPQSIAQFKELMDPQRENAVTLLRMLRAPQAPAAAADLRERDTASMDAALEVWGGIQGATVLVDGVEVGKGPIKTRLPLGSHIVRVEHEGFEPFESHFDLDGDKSVLVHLKSLTFWSRTSIRKVLGPVAVSFAMVCMLAAYLYFRPAQVQLTASVRNAPVDASPENVAPPATSHQVAAAVMEAKESTLSEEERLGKSDLLDTAASQQTPGAPAADPARSGVTEAVSTAPTRQTRVKSSVSPQSQVMNAPVRMDPTYPLKIGQDAYPDASRRAGEQGRCVVRLTVNKNGTVSNTSIQESSGFPRLDDACLNAFIGARMLPAMENGVAVRREVGIPIVWKLSEPPPAPSKPAVDQN